ncbi:MAG: aspartate carbamoyltransferase [Gammaproteobacteria bacterium]|nr:MAG: aspartate carbamoyltransferase [Gammaproteobacteria bacterium]
MIEPRPNEQTYAYVPDVSHPAENRYGQSVETVPPGDPLRGQSLNINGDAGIGANPNRYKQHGFYFTADNCIGCHACEAACAEKNDTPPHLAFRSVGYLEGGTWPAYARLNISMACNHCDNPVCLKGCPTRAYTKFAEYGAVLQDPDICFGCGYCTWVCPYNAPQLDPHAGHVSKCNMCIDRLEVGLKPACAAACLGGALDFGIIETAPANRVQVETRIPGFPDPAITHPNIRFQQAKRLPRELTRTDSMPLRYVRTDADHRPAVAERDSARAWNWKRLSTRENPLVVFTLLSQAVIGAVALLFLAPFFGIELLSPSTHPIAYPALLFGLIGFETFALVLSTLHLGRPHRFYRAFNNLRWSPVSREVAGIAMFYNLLGAYAFVSGVPALARLLPGDTAATLAEITGWGAVLAGLAALWFMHRIYRIPARPFWNHWQVLTSFYGSMLTLGAFVLALVHAVVALAAGESFAGVPAYLAWPMVAGLLLEGAGLWFHARDLRRGDGEAAASHAEQTTTFGYVYWARNALLGLAAVGAAALTSTSGALGLALWLGVGAAIVAAAVLGRMLFYALVIPTTLPGAFFWRNRAFEQHARETGLAALPQAGIATHAH